MSTKNTNKLQAAAKLVQMNLPIIPVHGLIDGKCTCYKGSKCTSVGKHPTVNDWENNPIPLDKFEELLHKNPHLNLGVITGKGLIVVDIDPKNGGLESFEQIKHLFNPTFTVDTGGGNGGKHFYYRLPDEYAETLKNSTSFVRGIDTRCNGGMAVAPGSLHKSGNYYKISEDSLNEIQPIPKELLDFILNTKKEKEKPRTQTELSSAIPEGERHSRLLSMVGNISKQGLDYDGVLAAAMSLNASVITPELSIKEVESIVKSIMKYDNEKLKQSAQDKASEKAQGILEELLSRGNFYKTNESFGFFDNQTEEYIVVGKDALDWKALIAEYGINASTHLYNFIHEHILAHCNSNAEEKEVYKYAHYSPKKKAVYVKIDNSRFYKITQDTVTLMHNGEDCIIFSNTIKSAPFEYIEPKEAIDFIGNYIINPINYNGAALNTETQRLLARAWFIALFMPELLRTRPIFLTIGSKGSGKTSVLKKFVKVLYGDKHNVAQMPSKLDDLDVLVIASHMLAIDNMDSYKSSYNDRLAVYATGGTMRKRKLYTDGVTYEAELDAFIGISSRAFGFRRDDLIQRLIIQVLDTIKDGFQSESELFEPIMENRSEILSQVFREIQKVLKALDSNDYKNYRSSFRMSDFARFFAMLIGSREEAEQHLTTLTAYQRQKSLEFDILLPLLSEHYERLGSMYQTANDLYYGLSAIATDYAQKYTFKNVFAENYSSAISLAKRINNIKDDIAEYIVIETRPAQGKQLGYKLSKGEKYDEIYKPFFFEKKDK